jgi:uncharacterized delta-60 repeat protein
MNRTLIASRIGSVVASLALAGGHLAADEIPGGVTPNDPTREWAFKYMRADGQVIPERGDVQAGGGELRQCHDFGPAAFGLDPRDPDPPPCLVSPPPPPGPRASGEIFSSATGDRYSVLAEAPVGDVEFPNEPIGGISSIIQYQSFRKKDANASLKLVVTDVAVEVVDFNSPDRPCPAGATANWCNVGGHVSLEVKAHSAAHPDLFNGRAFGMMHHSRGGPWYSSSNENDNNCNPPFSPNIPRCMLRNSDFTFDDDVLNDESRRHGRLKLNAPVSTEIDLSLLEVEEEFTLEIKAEAVAFNFSLANAYAGAFLQDPWRSAPEPMLNAAGLEPVEVMLSTVGLEPTNNPVLVPPAFNPALPAGCIPGPAAGELQFVAPGHTIGEAAGGAVILVLRTGGRAGAVSAAFTTGDGTATAGVDYAPVSSTITFGDGDDLPRRIPVPFIYDPSAEPDKTVNLTLSAPTGCASLGEPSSAVLTILDDAPPPPPPTEFAVGGTVSGLVGGGLVLQNSSDRLTPGNGAFTFPTLVRVGRSYNVRVATQPAAPAQVCSVANGSGRIVDADVTNVMVDCVTPPPNLALDPGFGDGGKATVGLTGEGRAVALQPDGKIVLAGGSGSSFGLVRYNADGSLDAGFGDGGRVTTALTSSREDEAYDVAVQADGRIVVAGSTMDSVFDELGDLGLVRHNADGSLDTSFGAGGTVILDFDGGYDSANAVVVQPDGKIVVAGSAQKGDPSTSFDSDFALVRLDADGSLDTSFGVGGKVTTHNDSWWDFAHAVALQPDGKIVLAGEAGPGDLIDHPPNFALVRLDADGSLDTSFGVGGKVTLNVSDLATGDDEAHGIAIQSDGKIVVAGFAYHLFSDAEDDFALVRLDADGSLDTGFGADGKVMTDLGSNYDYGHSVALQSDGRIVVVGSTVSASFTDSDLAVARYNADGSPDASFGSSGRVTVDFHGSRDFGYDVAIQPDGRTVAAGDAVNGTSTVFALTRFVP